MDYYQDQLKRIHTELNSEMKKARSELCELPEGRLLHFNHNGRLYYQQAGSSQEGYYRRGINRNPELIAQLARKEFLEQVHKAAERNVQLLNRVSKQYRSMDPAVIIAGMGTAARSLPEQIILGSGNGNYNQGWERASAERLEQHRLWAEEDYEQSTYRPEDKIHLTTSGIYVRSKSEALIMEKLYDYGVSARYEEVLWIDGRDFAPDYTFRDAAGEPFFWEHAGMMGDPQYVRRHLFKMREYERAGIVPWKNLIVTYDTVDGAVNMGVIDSIVRYQVLPRL